MACHHEHCKRTYLVRVCKDFLVIVGERPGFSRFHRVHGSTPGHTSLWSQGTEGILHLRGHGSWQDGSKNGGNDLHLLLFVDRRICLRLLWAKKVSSSFEGSVWWLVGGSGICCAKWGLINHNISNFKLQRHNLWVASRFVWWQTGGCCGQSGHTLWEELNSLVVRQLRFFQLSRCRRLINPQCFDHFDLQNGNKNFHW